MAAERIGKLREEIDSLRGQNAELESLIAQWQQTVDILQANEKRELALQQQKNPATAPTTYMWQKYFDHNGHPYYYNATTGQSSWEKPPDYGTKPRGPKGANLFIVRKCRRGELDNFYDQELRQAFERYGTLLRAEMSVDPDTGNSKGFGFVSYDNAESANAALAALDRQEVGGKTMRVEKTSDEVSRGPKTGWGGA